ncbi:hypothetical protein [Fodinibius sp. Rm-B-1B1-1]|uniref:hypothetical protein n=1 Tax=Fodinibius alkaliphilus TaxID=3140241 RepID=UPI00315997F8
MKRQEFRNRLQQGIKDELLTGIASYIEHRFEVYEQLLRYFSAVDRKYADGELLQQGLQSLLTNIENSLLKLDAPLLINKYLSAVDKVGGSFPDEVVWQQKTQRFAKQDGDAVAIMIGKKGKQITYGLLKFLHNSGQFFRGLIGREKKPYPKWEQQVPLENAIKCLLLQGGQVLEWEHDIERVQLEIVRDIEELLVQNDGNTQPDLLGFVSDQKEKLGEKKKILLQQIEEDLDAQQSHIEEVIEKVDTIEKSSAVFTNEQLQETRHNLLDQFKANRKQWLDVEQLYLERTRDVAHFLSLQNEMEGEIAEFRSTLETHFKEALNKPLSEFYQHIEKSIQTVGEEDSLVEVRSLKEKLEEFVELKLLAPLEKLHEKRILSGKVEHFFEDLLLMVGQSSEDAQLVFGSGLDTNPPTVNQEKVAWRQLVIRAFRELFMRSLQPDEQQYEQFIAQNIEEIQEINNIISVNLESALTVDDEDVEEQEDPTKVVREALQRILAKVEELNQSADEKWQQIEGALRGGNKQFFVSLLDLLHKGDSKQLQVLNAKYTVKEKTKDWKTILDSRWARAEDQLMLWSRFLWKKGKGYADSVKSLLGFKKSGVQESRRADIATYLSETDKQMKGLPYIYRRLFDFKSLADKRFFEPANDSVVLFKKAYEQWQNEFSTNFAVVGEKGSGKSSFLKLMIETEFSQSEPQILEFNKTIWDEQQLVDKVISVLQVEHAESVEELIAEIKEKNQRSVIVLESVQNCFVRDINGFKAIEKLMYLISETRDNLFWVVSCSRYAWSFLDKVMQLSEYFSHVSKSDSLTADQLEQVILNRHQASGYSLYFEPDEQVLQSRTYRKLKDSEEEVQTYLKEEYFEELTKLAEGNPSIAMIFWIRSIREFDETNFYIKPLEITSVEMIEDLNPQVLFTLEAFVLHDTLSDTELAMIMDNTIEESRLLINRLRSRGMLVDKEGSSTINHLMYRQIVRVLKERNIIHLG